MGSLYGAVTDTTTAKAPAIIIEARGPLPPSSSSIPPTGRATKKHGEESGSLLIGINMAEEKTNPMNSSNEDHDANGSGIFGRGSRRQDNNRLVTAFLVVNYMIGSGILNTPQTFRDSGVAATTVLYLVASPAVWLGAVALIQAAEVSSFGGGNQGGGGKLEDLEFATLAKRTLGKHGPALVDVSIVVQNFGAVCSYVILVGGLTTSMLAEWSEGAAAAFAWWQSFYVVTPLIVLFMVLPPCLVRHFSNLRWLAAFSLFAIGAVVLLVALGGPHYAAAERAVVGVETALDAPLLWWNWTGAFAKMGSTIFAITFAAAALHSYSAMDQRTEREWKAVTGISVVTGSVVCYCTGLTGYLSFRGATEGDILDNFSGPLAACFKVLVVLHLVLYIPSEVVILRHSLFTLIGRDVMVLSFSMVSSVTFGVLAAIVGVVCALMLGGIAQGDLFGYVLDLTGGITASLTGFVLPAVTYLRATKDMDGQSGADGESIAAYRRSCRVLAVFGTAVMVMVPIAVVVTALGKRE